MWPLDSKEISFNSYLESTYYMSPASCWERSKVENKATPHSHGASCQAKIDINQIIIPKKVKLQW